MKTHQTEEEYEEENKNQKPWALKSPKTGKTRNINRGARHQAATHQTTSEKCPLAAINKRLSAPGKRAKKLRKRRKNRLSRRPQRSNFLSKKVNKKDAKQKNSQSQKTNPRGRNKTEKSCPSSKNTEKLPKIEGGNPKHKLRQKQEQVTRQEYPYLVTTTKKYAKLLPQTGSNKTGTKSRAVALTNVASPEP